MIFKGSGSAWAVAGSRIERNDAQTQRHDVAKQARLGMKTLVGLGGFKTARDFLTNRQYKTSFI